MRSILLSAVLFLVSSLGAQIRPGDNGISVTNGTSAAGNLCRGFTCTPYVLRVRRAAVLTVSLRGTFKQPFWLLLGFRASACARIPGIKNGLILNLPVFPAAAGSLSTPDRILACPGGLHVLKWKLPLLPKGFRFSLQALQMTAWTSGVLPTFTPAVTIETR